MSFLSLGLVLFALSVDLLFCYETVRAREVELKTRLIETNKKAAALESMVPQLQQERERLTKQIADKQIFLDQSFTEMKNR